MHRRKMLTGLAGLGLAASTAPLWAPKDAYALGLPKDKIKRIRYYIDPKRRGGLAHEPTFNQSANIVIIETEGGLSGIGEGGTPDLMNQCAGMLIGEDPFRVEHLWQEVFRGYFYPAGHEKIDALGALDLALWDLKGKALGVPVWQLLGGKSRDHVECYATGGFPIPPGGTLEDAARNCIAAGFAAYRYQTNMASNLVDRFALVDQLAADCALIRKGVGQSGRWAIDFHQELDPEDAVTLCTLIEPLHPYFCEDLIRSENWETYKIIRERTKVPIATGEEFGAKWDINALIEQQLIDYARVTLPNVGGITEYMKIQALAETHYCGMIPHFTGPVGEAALIHCLTASSLPAIMEVGGGIAKTEIAYMPQSYDFKDGKMWPNERPGLGVTVDTSKLHLAADYTEHYAQTQLNHRPDGSFTNW